MHNQIRLAVPADIPQLCRLRLAYFDEEFGTLPSDKLSAIKAHLPAYFTQHLGTGCIAAVEKPANPTFPCGRSGYVLGVYTEPDYRGQGLATQIMTLILAEAKRLALDTVTLSASDMGRGIYEKLGFTVKQSKFTEMEWFPE